MARRRPAAGRDRGGAGIQASRPSRTRLATALGALAGLAGVTAYGRSAGGDIATLVALLGAGGLLVLSIGLWRRWPSTVPWSVLLCAAGYLFSRHGHAVVDGWAALVGVALLVSAELAWWSLEHDPRIAQERPVLVRRLATLVGLALSSTVVAAFLLATAAFAAPAGVLLAALGVAAAVAAVALVLRLLRAT